jgi:hypothetical protein
VLLPSSSSLADVAGLGCKCGIGKGNILHLYPDSSYPSLIAVMVVSSLASLRPLGRKKTPLRVSLQITMREVARWNIVTPAPVRELSECLVWFGDGTDLFGCREVKVRR